MKVLVCEDNFAGFLTAVFDSFYQHKDAEKICPAWHEFSFFDEQVEIVADLKKADRVRGGIIKKAGVDAFLEVSDAFLSCNPDKYNIIFQYLKLLIRHGSVVRQMHGEKAVMDFYYVINKVRGEVHRMHGFLRFMELSNGIFYAFFDSDNDIIELLPSHFTARFNTEKFALHDIKRKKMVAYDGKEVHKFLMPDKVEVELSEQEPLFQMLWKQYFNNVAVEGRENYKLQRGFLPKKYRHFMNEF